MSEASEQPERRSARRSVRWRRRAKFAAVALGAWLIAIWMWSSLRERIGRPELEGSSVDAWHVGHRIVDRKGNLLRELPTDHGRRGRPLDLEAMGSRVVTATVVSEDVDFFSHDGINRLAILRAAAQNVSNARVVSGASTITQQLVKLLDNRGVVGPRTLGIKITEAARAQNLEAELSKAEILVEYMNRLPYGHGLIGPEAAAQGYFGVASHQLSWAHAAFIAVLPRAPARFDPLDHFDRAIDRQKKLLHALHREGHLDDAALTRALAEPIEPRAVEHAFAAPHFVQTLLAEDRLDKEAVTQTTLDLSLQRDVEGLVGTHMASMTEFSAHDAAVLVVDNDSGDILAWVGSTDFFDDAIAGQVDMVRAKRQPGSTLKPFVYALAFAAGLTPADMLADVPTTFREGQGHAYIPKNFHGDFVGPVPAREALAASLNVPAVRLLGDVGTETFLTFLHTLGMASLTEEADHYGLALALGSGEVTLRELAAAYATLARGGEYLPLRYTTADAAVARERVLPAATAASVTDVLSDPLARARLVAGRSPFTLGFDVAVKTGTSTGYRDAWTAGYTAERTVVVWVGNASGSPTKKVTGAHGAGGLFGDVMRRSMRDVGRRAPLWDPALLVSAEVCALSGKRAGPACPHARPARFTADQVPTEACTAHVHASRADDGGWRCDSDGSDTLVVLPEAYDTWLHTMPPGAPGKDPDGLPWFPASELACGAATDGPPTIRVIEPAEGVVVWVQDDSDRVELVADVHGAASFTGAVEFVVDGRVAATARRSDKESEGGYRALVRLQRGDHEVVARPANPRARFVLEASTFSIR